MAREIITLSNGKKVANFSSPHPFTFTDGSVIPAVSKEESERLKVNFIETEHPDKSGDILKGRNYLVDQLRQRRQGRVSFKVYDSAKYVLNAFAGGYAFQYKKLGSGLLERANEGMYRTLMEGFECALSQFQGLMVDDEDNLNYAKDDRTGKLYLSTRMSRG